MVLVEIQGQDMRGKSLREAGALLKSAGRPVRLAFVDEPASGVEPEPEPRPGALNAPGHWDQMISYTQRNPEAETLAEALYASMRERGKTVWLDVKMAKLNEAAMKEAAQN